MSDRIFLEGLRVPCKIGITPEERRVPQEVLIDISLYMSLARAGASDSLEETVNYRSAVEEVSRLASSREFVLLEGLAEAVASLALRFGAERAKVRVRKAKYSGDPSIGVEIERRKG